METKTRKKKILSALRLLILVLIAACAGYFMNYYHAEDVDSYIDGSITDGVQATHQENSGYSAWYFDGPGSDTALIFYPGAKVEATAYAPLMHELAADGIDCYLVEFPLHFAFFNMDAAGSIMNANGELYEKWILGGHSLGGAMAANLAAKAEDGKYDGLALLAAFGTKAASNIDIISIYGSEDKVVNTESLEKYKEMEAEAGVAVDEEVLQGCNHAQFGSYGEQKGDGEATESREYQTETTAGLIEDFFGAEAE